MMLGASQGTGPEYDAAFLLPLCSPAALCRTEGVCGGCVDIASADARAEASAEARLTTASVQIFCSD